MSSIEEVPYLNRTNPNLINNINIQDIAKSKNIDICLMEKDKEIINLSNQISTLKNNAERLQKIIKEKDMEINSLKSDILSINNDQKIKEDENIILKGKINSLLQELTNRKKEMELISSNNIGNMKNISQAFDTKMLEYKNLLKNYNEMSRDLNALSEKLILNEKDMMNQQKIIQDLRNENKKIILLNKDLNEKEKTIKNLEKIIKENKEEIYQNQREKKFLNDQIQNLSTKEEFLYKTRLNLQEYENVINDMKNNFNKKIKNKELIIKEYQNDIKNYQTNNENLINYMIGQITQVRNNFEKHMINPLFTDDILNHFSQPNENDSKYELIHQNFILLNNKMIEYKNKTNAELIRLKNELEEEQNNQKNLLNNIQLQKMSKNSIENSITELKKIVEIKNEEIRELNLKLNKLINENAKNVNKYNNINNAGNKLFNDFFQKFFEIVTNFYIENINKKSNLFQIQTFPNFSILDPQPKKFNDILITLKIFIDYTNSISNQLTSIYNNSRINLSGQKNNNMNTNKMKENVENQDLQKKIKEMTDLLKQSNYYLDISRQENKKIKDKYNLLMNNFNSIKNMDNSQNRFNSASFEEINKVNSNNNDISLSNPTLSKKLINNSNLAVNPNNSNSFNLINNNNKMNVFNNNNENLNMNYNNMMNNINDINNINDNNMIENQMYEEDEENGDGEAVENHGQNFENDVKNAENERALNAFINKYTNDENMNNIQQNFEGNNDYNYNEAENDQEQEEIYFDENEGGEEYNEMNFENEEGDNYEEEINNDYDNGPNNN